MKTALLFLGRTLLIASVGWGAFQLGGMYIMTLPFMQPSQTDADNAASARASRDHSTYPLVERMARMRVQRNTAASQDSDKWKCRGRVASSSIGQSVDEICEPDEQ